jgi:1-aminocyclopropane-1-carboxylate deaminase/D-cysteine desulfhydrase-like pyridoxal-dependent ACC family enzyme
MQAASTTEGVAPERVTGPIRERIARVPRVPFNDLPTPVQRAARLSDELGIDLWIKRDDLSETFGGNKSRTLEFRLAEALEQDPDPLILTVEGISNTAPATAKVCNRLGVPLLFVLRDQPETTLQGNLFLSHLFGVEVRRFHGAGLAAAYPAIDAMVEELRSQGRNPVVFNRIPSFFGYGPTLAYLEATLEVYEAEPALRPDHVYITSTGKSQAGVLAASAFLGYGARVVGVTPHGKPDTAKILASVADVAERLGIDVSVSESDVHSDTRHLEGGYGVMTPEAADALLRVARAEGLLLDPDRTAKTMASLLADVDAGVVKPGETVLFFHTGGVASLFAHAEELLSRVGAAW